MTRRMRESMLTRLIANPTLFAESKGLIQPEHFNELDEVGLSFFWRAVLDIHERFGTLTYDAVVDHLEGLAADHPSSGPSENELQDLLSDDPDAPGLLYHALHVVDPDALPIDQGRDMVRRFLEERTIADAMRDAIDSMGGGTAEDFGSMLQELNRRREVIDRLGSGSPVASMAAKTSAFRDRLAVYRGRELVGLSTGMRWIDDRTLGLRGLILVGAMPNVGKTALVCQLGVNVARRHERNDAVFVFFSLEMPDTEIYARIYCRLAGMDWKTFMLGSEELRGRGGPHFSDAHQERLDNADRVLDEQQIGRRTYVFDRHAVGGDLTAGRMLQMIEAAKREAGASRALVAVDYLQLLPVPDDVLRRGDLEADKFRVRSLQQVVESTKTPANPAGDPVVAISEARKPDTSKEAWGQSLSELMGSARLGYAADAVFLYRRMSKADLKNFFGVDENDADRRIEDLQRRGIAPVVLSLSKGRDGMTIGECGLEFHWQRSEFTELTPDVPPSVLPPRTGMARETVAARRHVTNGRGDRRRPDGRRARV